MGNTTNELQVIYSDFVMLVPMLKVSFAVVVGFLWSLCSKCRGGKVRWWQQHTTPMYLVLLMTLVTELLTFNHELNAPADEQNALFSHPPHPLVNRSNRANCMQVWEQDQSLDEATHSRWIRTVASGAPIFVTITFLVTAFATFRHVRAAKQTPLWVQGNRGATLWILQLPVVYSMTALFSVEKGLQQARIGGYLCAAQERFAPFYIEAGLSFGDGYEAIALLLFADITMNLIEHVVDKTVMQAETVKKKLEKVDNALQNDNKGHLRKDLHDVAQLNEKVMTRLEQMSETLVHSTWILSTLGIKYFALTCIVMALPQILACQAIAWDMEHPYFDVLSAFSENWSQTFKGMGLLGSCVAIHNMVSIEQHFDAAFLEGYSAKLKFISVKIMVTIVFIQELVLPIAFSLTATRSILLDASLRIIEFSFIACFNVMAWPIDQAFYDMEAIDLGEKLEGLTENLLEDGLLGKMGETSTKQQSLLRESSSKKQQFKIAAEMK